MSKDGRRFLAMKENSKKKMPVNLWQSWMSPLQTARARDRAGIFCPIDEAGLMQRLKALVEPAKNKNDVRAVILAEMKTQLTAMRSRLEKRLIAERDGADYVGAHALGMDVLIRSALNLACSHIFKKAPGFGVMAVGGYGRGELAPHSDIDLLFVMPDSGAKKQEPIIEFLLYLLWDMGLTVGHASRTIRQNLAAAEEDTTICTSLLEMRPIGGDSIVTDKMMAAFSRWLKRQSVAPFLSAKLEERDARITRTGGTRYAVEPNVKDGKGGLRDLHTLFWMAKYAYRVNSAAEFLETGILRQTEARSFAAAQRFLWTVRCFLHLYHGREDDRLSFDAQLEIAPKMRFSDRGGLRGVERFMKRYYLAARHVGNLTRIFCAALETDFDRRPRLSLKKFWLADAASDLDIAPFVLEKGRLHLPENMRFRDDLDQIIRLFNFALIHELDIHPGTLRRLTRAVRAARTAQLQTAQTHEIFLQIISGTGNPERVLRLMNESGWLGIYMPDFGRIVGMMQFDMYHSYTVDEHTLKAIGILHGIETGALRQAAPVATEVMPEIGSRRALYVAMLLHDIAKGRGGDHSVLGAEVALAVCPRLGLSHEETETVSWLILHHLLMSKIAFRYDLNDPQTIEDFASIVQSPERLKLLLVLTVADIRAVGPNIWNGWKAALMRDLYYRCDAVLRGADPAVIALGNAEEARQEAAAKLADWDAARFAAHAANMPLTYWTGFDCESQVRHARLCDEFANQDALLLIDFKPDPARRITELTILTVDDPGLFARIAGAVAAAGANIVGARITTCHDGTVLDVFFLQDMKNQAIEDQDELARIRTTLEKSLTGSLKLEKALLARWQQTPLRVRQMPVPSRVLLSNKISNTHSVIEVNGRDFPGLLHKITLCLAGLGLQIQTATVSTYGERVVDVFYVKDIFGLQIQSETRQQTIRNQLLAVFDDADEEAV